MPVQSEFTFLAYDVEAITELWPGVKSSIFLKNRHFILPPISNEIGGAYCFAFVSPFVHPFAALFVHAIS